MLSVSDLNQVEIGYKTYSWLKFILQIKLLVIGYHCYMEKEEQETHKAKVGQHYNYTGT